MNPEIVFILGCTGLGFVIAFGLWGYARNTLLEADLLSLRADFDAVMAKNGLSNTPAHTAFRGALIDLRLIAGLSWAATFFRIHMIRNHKTPTADATKDWEGVEEKWKVAVDMYKRLPQEAKMVGWRLMFRLLGHFLLWPPNLFTLFLIVCVMLFSKTAERVSWLSSFLQLPGLLTRDVLSRNGASLQH